MVNELSRLWINIVLRENIQWHTEMFNQHLRIPPLGVVERLLFVGSLVVNLCFIIFIS
jgi:hypothetical protein